MLFPNKALLPHPLYVSDLDGTLLNEKGELSSFSRHALRKILAAGTLFTIASARSLVTIRECLGDLPLELPIIHMNGGWITDYSGEKEYFFCNISQNNVFQIASLFHQNNITFLAFGKNKENSRPFCTLPLPRLRNAAAENFLRERKKKQDPRLLEETFILTFEKRETVAFTIIEEISRSHKIMEWLSELGITQNFSIYNMGQSMLHGTVYEWTILQDKVATKGYGLMTVCDILGIEANQTIVFGNQLNDYPLFEASRNQGGKALLVANGTDKLREVATEIIGDHTEDSVIQYILKEQAL